MQTTILATVQNADTNDGSGWGLVADYVKKASVTKRFALGFCALLSGLGWAMMIGLLLIVQEAILI